MLHHQYWRAIGRKTHQEFFQCLGTARRSADKNHLLPPAASPNAQDGILLCTIQLIERAACTKKNTFCTDTNRVPGICQMPSTTPFASDVQRFDLVSAYTVLPRERKRSAAWRKLSECPANISPSSCIKGTKRDRILYCVGLSK